jgi:diguanylate cyclase (GGDEF)-like protein
MGAGSAGRARRVTLDNEGEDRLSHGDVVGLEILAPLGHGSSAVVYRARRNGQDYALKLLRAAVVGDGAIEAFHREAALLACVTHPGLPRVHEVGLVRERAYLVMDLVEGERLSASLAAGPLEVDRAVALGRDIAAALDAAHRVGIVHRDIKPDNIVLGEDGRARLVDFGLATRIDQDMGDGVVGTMTYGAPEQSGMLKRPVDARTDLYSLGVVLFECLTGSPPFVSSDIGEVVRLHATMPAPDVRTVRPEVGDLLAEVVAKLLAKEPDDRYQSAEGLLVDMQSLAGQPGLSGPVPGRSDHPTRRSDIALVGREHELGALRERWQRAATGCGGMVLVHGPSGSGKSRLVRELLAEVRDDGYLVLEGKSSPDDPVPLAPLRAAVEGHIERTAALTGENLRDALEGLRVAAGPAAGLLATLFPRLMPLLGAQGAGAPDQHGQFPGAVAAFLTRLASDRPAVLHLDDVQWLDEASLRVLRLMAVDLKTSSLLVVMTSRDDPDCRPALDASRSALAGVIDTTVTAGPMDARSVEQIVFEISGGMGIDDEATAMVVARTGGNALALLEYLAAAMQSCVLRPAWGRWALDVDRLGELPLSGTALDLIENRVRELDVEARRVLGVAALLGTRFSTDLLARVCGMGLRRAGLVVTKATWAHLVEPRGDGQHAFLHDCVREALLARLGPEDLRRHHQRIADVLDGEPGGDPATVYAAARHCQFGETERNQAQLLRTNRAAGLLALEEQAPDQAVELLQRAVAATADGSTSSGEKAGTDLLRALGTACHRAGRFADAAEAFHRALGSSSDPMERAGILLLIASVHDSTWNSAEEIAAAEQGLAELGRPLSRSRSRLLLSSIGLFLLGYLVGLTRLGYGTLEGRRREKYRLLSMLYGALGMAYARELKPRTSALISLRELYLVNRIGDCAESVRAKAGLSLLARNVGLNRLADRACERAKKAADQLGNPQVRANIAWMDAVGYHGCGGDDGARLRQVLGEQGRWLDAGQYLDGLIVLCWDSLLHGDMAAAQALFSHRLERVSLSGQVGRNAVVAAEACLLAMQGRAVEAVGHLNAMRATAGMPMWERVDVIIATVLCAIEQGDLGASFDEAVKELEDLGLSPVSLLPAQRIIFVYQAYGRVEQCRIALPGRRAERLRAAEQAVVALGKIAARPLLAAHHRVLQAALFQLAGQPEEALRHLEKAAATLRRVDSPLVTYETARITARALTELGHRHGAEMQIRCALTVASQQQWPHRARWIRAELGPELTGSHLTGSNLTGSNLTGELDGVSRHRSEGTHAHEGIPCSVYRRRLAALEQVSRVASRVGDPEDLARTALDETVRMFNAERAALFLLEGDPARPVPHLGRDAEGHDLPQFSGFSASLVDRVCRAQEPAVITSADDGTEIGTSSVAVHGLRSVMAAPLQLDGRLLGVVYLDSRVAKGIFTPDDAGALVAVGNYVAGALETARAAQLELAVIKANEQRDLAETLRATIADLGGTLQPAEVLHRLLLAIIRAVGADAGWLLQPDGQTWTVQASAQAAVLDLQKHLGPVTIGPDPVLSQLLERGAPMVAGPDASRPGLLASAPVSTRSWMAVPLRREAGPPGLLLLASAQQDAYQLEDTYLASALAGEGFIAYDNARLFAQVQRLATTDELTGIHNRRHFFEKAAHKLARARDQNRPLAVMMADIDHFKRVNDTHGHQVGDEVIREIADRFCQNVRSGDILGRYGGEEFVLVTDGDAGGALAERLRHAVLESPVLTPAGPLAVTVSIGLANVRPVDTDIETALTRADKCLYQAKQAGRNRVVTE